MVLQQEWTGLYLIQAKDGAISWVEEPKYAKPWMSKYAAKQFVKLKGLAGVKAVLHHPATEKRKS